MEKDDLHIFSIEDIEELLESVKDTYRIISRQIADFSEADIPVHKIKELNKLRTKISQYENEIKSRTGSDNNKFEFGSPQKILFLSANPSNTARLKIDEEVRKIKNNLKMADCRDNLKLTQEWAITAETIMQAILDETPQIVHFSGHGTQEGIIISDEIGNSNIINDQAISYLFEIFKESVYCVILNSCYSENQAKEIKKHIPFVIGMRSAITDESAISFSSGFYKAIGAGKDIPFAYKLGIAAIKLEGYKNHNIPILHD